MSTYTKTTLELMAFRDAHRLKRKDIATATGASIHSVDSWFNPDTSRNSRDIPENLFRLLKYEVLYNSKLVTLSGVIPDFLKRQSN